MVLFFTLFVSSPCGVYFVFGVKYSLTLFFLSFCHLITTYISNPFPTDLECHVYHTLIISVNLDLISGSSPVLFLPDTLFYHLNLTLFSESLW